MMQLVLFVLVKKEGVRVAASTALSALGRAKNPHNMRDLGAPDEKMQRGRVVEEASNATMESRKGANVVVDSSGTKAKQKTPPPSSMAKGELETTKTHAACNAPQLLNGWCNFTSCCNLNACEDKIHCECDPGFHLSGRARCNQLWIQLPKCDWTNRTYETKYGVLVSLTVEVPRALLEKPSGQHTVLDVILLKVAGEASRISLVANSDTNTFSTLFFYMEGRVDATALAGEEGQLSGMLKDILSLPQLPQVKLRVGELVKFTLPRDKFALPDASEPTTPSLLPMFAGCVVLLAILGALYCSSSPEIRRRYRNRVQPKVHGRLLDDGDDADVGLLKI